MSDVCKHVLKTGLVIDFIFHSYGCLDSSSIRGSMHQQRNRRWQLGSRCKVSVVLEASLIISLIATALVIFILHPSFQIQTLIKAVAWGHATISVGGDVSSLNCLLLTIYFCHNITIFSWKFFPYNVLTIPRYK